VLNIFKQIDIYIFAIGLHYIKCIKIVTTKNAFRESESELLAQRTDKNEIHHLLH